ncbi:DUF4325 domain-containing protein [Candidatus Parcubacteria bacterium]|nr:DUF4325 domain-containing protein [Candidatus Parcubacteria bacterium]
MDIKALILKHLKKNKKVKVADVVKATGFSRAYINRSFRELVNQEKIALIGKANQAHYIEARKSVVRKTKREILSIKRILKNKNLSESDILDQIKEDCGIFLDLPKNIVSILDYAFTEMLNNAIEHSNSKEIVVIMEKDKFSVNFEVIDFGIGIFNNLMEKRGLKNELEAIQDLLKGKQTTVPKEHTGEGIFFTSKVADKLIINSSTKKLIIDNQLNDIFIKDIKAIKGTKVRFEIGKKAMQNLNAIFKKFAGNTFEFSKTEVTVDLYQMNNVFISRSQARRVLSGLDKFRTIIIDFKNINTIGQSFADEVFRVWQSHHLEIDIRYKNANENVLFMIKRAQIKN